MHYKPATTIHWMSATAAALLLASTVTPLSDATAQEAADATQSAVTDESIARAVLAELQYSELLMTEELDATADDGVVTLTGTVGTLAAHNQADDIAATIRGVRGVINRIDIEHEAVPIDELETNVRSALAENAATDLYELEVEITAPGQVALEGQVESWAERSLSERVVATVPGVESIYNRIEVDTSRYYRAAEELDAEITERLRWNAQIDGALIDVLVRDGSRVTLSGTVASLAEKRLAVELAHVAGVQSVDADHLEVADWADGPLVR